MEAELILIVVAKEIVKEAAELTQTGDNLVRDLLKEMADRRKKQCTE